MTVDDFIQVFNARVKRCYNLHRSFNEADTEFFIMLSSACGAFGNPGQCNYAASSTFLDAFALYRQSLGLPASTTYIGYAENIGYVSRTPETEAMFSKRGLQPLSEKDILEAVEAAIMTGRSKSSGIYDPLSSSQIIQGADWIKSSGQMAEITAKDARFSTSLRRTDMTTMANLSTPREIPDPRRLQSPCAIRSVQSEKMDVLSVKKASSQWSMPPSQQGWLKSSVSTRRAFNVVLGSVTIVVYSTFT